MLHGELKLGYLLFFLARTLFIDFKRFVGVWKQIARNDYDEISYSLSGEIKK